jgi:hypothetical protein
VCPGLLEVPTFGASIGGPEVSRAADTKRTNKDVAGVSDLPTTPEPMESDLEEALLLSSPSTQAECLAEGSDI